MSMPIITIQEKITNQVVFNEFSMARSFRKNFIEAASQGSNIYANKVFCAWDFGIATDEAAKLKAKSIHTEFKVCANHYIYIFICYG